MNRRAWAVAAGFVVSGVVLVMLLRDTDFAAVGRAAAGVTPWVWAAATLGLLASYLLRALRLQAEWLPRIGVGWRDCLHLMLLHNAAVNLLPLRAGEGGYAWWLHTQWGVPLVDAMTSLVRLRLQDAALLAALAIGLLLPLPAPAAVMLTAALLLTCVLAVPALLEWVRPLRRRAGKLGRFAERLAGAWDANAAGDRHSAWVYGAANWCLKLLVLGLLLGGLADLSPSQAVRGALAGELAAVVPLQGPAGLGTYEAAVWGGTALHGASDMSRVAGAALALHVFSLSVSLAAAAASLLLHRPRARREPAGTATNWSHR